jgi:putative SOS response-associated peptidase YedK
MQPYLIHPEDMQVMALASLYEYWRSPEVRRDDEGGAANRMRSIRPRQSR